MKTRDELQALPPLAFWTVNVWSRQGYSLGTEIYFSQARAKDRADFWRTKDGCRYEASVDPCKEGPQGALLQD